MYYNCNALEKKNKKYNEERKTLCTIMCRVT